MKILKHKDAINRRLLPGIYRVFYLNRTVLGWVEDETQDLKTFV